MEYVGYAVAVAGVVLNICNLYCGVKQYGSLKAYFAACPG
jgi:hypothetical protein